MSLRFLFSTLRISSKPALNLAKTPPFNHLKPSLIPQACVLAKAFSTGLLRNPVWLRQSLLQTQRPVQSNQVRTVIKFSMQKGKRKRVRAVTQRFYRLHWGGWIRTIAGRSRRVYAMSWSRRKRVKQHVLCNATQSTLLDKMVTNFWRKPKYYVDDPYEPYHTREEYYCTYRKPKPYYPPE